MKRLLAGSFFRHLLTAVGGGIAVSGGIDPDAITTALAPDATITRTELFGAVAVIVGYWMSVNEKKQRFE